MLRVTIAIFALSAMAAGPNGSLYQPAYCFDHELRQPAADYCPQEGDIVFFTFEDNKLWSIGFKMALAGPPDHTGVVVRMPDGTLGCLESGPDDSTKVEVCSLIERLRFHHCNRGRVWIRRRVEPLTAEQDCRLTQFALSERGKRYAVWRMMAQVTPLRLRGPVRTHFCAKPLGPHSSYMCAELVVEALVFAGAIDGSSARPRATYPEDYFFDRSRNHFLNRHFNLVCSWTPPQRWVLGDCPSCKLPKPKHGHANPEGIPVHPYYLAYP